MGEDIAYVRKKTREDFLFSLRIKFEKPVGKVKRSEENSIFRLQIYIFKLKICIFKLQICIFRLKIEFSSDVLTFCLGISPFVRKVFLFIFVGNPWRGEAWQRSIPEES